MRYVLTVFRKDLEELWGSRWLLISLTVVLVVLLGFVARLDSEPVTLRVQVVEDGIVDERKPPGYWAQRVEQLMPRLARVEFIERPRQSPPEVFQGTVSVPAFMQRKQLDLLVVIRGGHYWLYARGADAYGLNRLTELAWSLESLLFSEELRLTPWPENFSVVDLYPATTPYNMALLAVFIALAAQFIAFLMAATGVAREREAHTLEVLLAAPRSGPYKLLLAKLLTAVAASAAILVLLTVSARALLGVAIQQHVLEALGLQVLGLTSAALLGLVCSAAVRSQLISSELRR
jgi:hypothetical protein